MSWSETRRGQRFERDDGLLVTWAAWAPRPWIVVDFAHTAHYWVHQRSFNSANNARQFADKHVPVDDTGHRRAALQQKVGEG